MAFKRGIDLADFKDDPKAALEDRISSIVRYVFLHRANKKVQICDVHVYHWSAYSTTIRTKSFAISGTYLYSVKASFSKATGEPLRADVNIEIPRGRTDFRVKVVNKDKKTILVPLVGDQKLPGILCERGDKLEPEELVQFMVKIVTSGRSEYQQPTPSTADTIEAELLAQIQALNKEIAAVICDVVQSRGKQALKRLADKVKASIKDNGGPIEDWLSEYNASPDWSDPQGWSTYLSPIVVSELLSEKDVWEHCLSEIFSDQEYAINALEEIDTYLYLLRFCSRIPAELTKAALGRVQLLRQEVAEGRAKRANLVEVLLP